MAGTKKISRPADTQKSAEKALIEVTVKGKVTNYGEDIFVNVSGHEHPIQWVGHDTWKGKVEIPLNKEIQYQYVMKRGGHEIERTSPKKRVFTKTPVVDNWS